MAARQPSSEAPPRKLSLGWKGKLSQSGADLYREKSPALVPDWSALNKNKYFKYSQFDWSKKQLSRLVGRKVSEDINVI